MILLAGFNFSLKAGDKTALFFAPTLIHHFIPTKLILITLNQLNNTTALMPTV